MLQNSTDTRREFDTKITNTTQATKWEGAFDTKFTGYSYRNLPNSSRCKKSRTHAKFNKLSKNVEVREAFATKFIDTNAKIYYLYMQKFRNSFKN